MKSIINKIIISFILFSFVSCDESVLDLSNPQSYVTDNYFLSPSEIEQSVNAVYAGLYFKGLYNHEGWQTIDGIGLELEEGPSSAGETNVLAIYNFSHNNANPVIEEMWKSYYRIILRANLVMEVADRYVKANGSSTLMDRYKGEASFFRGWAYFQLVNNWGRVPLRLIYDQTNNIDAPRTDVDKIWKVAEDDLKKAIAVLPVSYESKDLGRVTKGAAIAMLGKMYLFQKRWTEAATELAKLDNAPFNYKLLPANQWFNNFGEDPATENNAESLFEVQFSWFSGNFEWGAFVPNGNETSETAPSTQNTRPQLYGFKDWSNWKFNTNRAKEFKYADETGKVIVDPRARLTFYGNSEMGDTTYWDFDPAKVQKFDFKTLGFWYRKYNNYEYKTNESNLKTGNNDRVIRFADVLLMWAEAKLQMGDTPGCIALINRVRSRIGAFEYTAAKYNKDQAFELLKRERVLELIGEHHRFDDLRRWGIAKEAINNEMFQRNGQRNFQDKHLLFPIPLGERDKNPGLANDVANDWN